MLILSSVNFIFLFFIQQKQSFFKFCFWLDFTFKNTFKSHLVFKDLKMGFNDGISFNDRQI